MGYLLGEAYSEEYRIGVVRQYGDERVEAISDCMDLDTCAEEFGVMAADCAQSVARPRDEARGPRRRSPPSVRMVARIFGSMRGLWRGCRTLVAAAPTP